MTVTSWRGILWSGVYAASDSENNLLCDDVARSDACNSLASLAESGAGGAFAIGLSSQLHLPTMSGGGRLLHVDRESLGEACRGHEYHPQTLTIVDFTAQVLSRSCVLRFPSSSTAWAWSLERYVLVC